MGALHRLPLHYSRKGDAPCLDQLQAREDATEFSGPGRSSFGGRNARGVRFLPARTADRRYAAESGARCGGGHEWVNAAAPRGPLAVRLAAARVFLDATMLKLVVAIYLMEFVIIKYKRTGL